MKTRHLALLSAFVPLTAFAGCGGGSSNNGPATPTPAPTFIAPTGGGNGNNQTVVVPQTLLRLPGGQIAALNLTRVAGLAEGNLRVFNRSASGSSLAPNLYKVPGAFSAPTAFSVQNTGSPLSTDKFTLAGNLPLDKSSNGSYNLTLGRSVGNGTLLANNTTAVLPQAGGYSVKDSDLQFSNFTETSMSGFGAPLDVVSASHNASTGGGGFDGVNVNPANVGAYTYRIRGDQFFPNLRLVGVRDLNGGSLQTLVAEVELNSVTPNPTSFSPGQTFSLTPGATNGGISASVKISYNGRSYISNSGSLTIRSLTATDDLNDILYDTEAEAITIGLNDVGMVFPGNGNVQSSFTANGNIASYGLTNFFDVQ